MQDKYQVLKQYFGYTSFREGQEYLIDSILEGKDTLGIMPTGAGKSICYQVPAMLLPGITLVVSPLISLMNDQVRSLKEVGIAAAYLNSSLTMGQFYKALENAAKGMYKLIYVAPERLETDAFLQFARQAPISMVTVDEAHCISQWGQDFRPSYLKIITFLQQLPKRPVVSAFTATATQTVQEDIVRILQLQHPAALVTGFDRSNLYYEVQQTKEKLQAVCAYLKEHEEESGIIYCATRKKVEEVWETLQEMGYPVTRYHAGLSDQERGNNQDDFIYDRKPIMVATNAFGMGIDKSNVRYVIHYNMPKNMENYYQEAGRAGRDGEPAECILLYHGQDVIINQFLIEKGNENTELDAVTAQLVQEQDRERLKQMTFYCTTKDCLREYILRYFGERTEHYCGNCSNCLQEYEEVDVSAICRYIIGCVKECEGRYGITMIVDCVKGAKNQKIMRSRMTDNSYYGTCITEQVSKLRSIINMLLLDGYLISTKGQYPVLQMSRLGQQFLADEEGYITMKMAKEEPEVVPEEVVAAKTQNKVAKQSASKTTAKKFGKKTSKTLSSEEKELFERLRMLRKTLAGQYHVPPYIIFSDKTLIDMCHKRPKNKVQMLAVNGMGEVKYQKYGEDFLEVLNKA